MLPPLRAILERTAQPPPDDNEYTGKWTSTVRANRRIFYQLTDQENMTHTCIAPIGYTIATLHLLKVVAKNSIMFWNIGVLHM